MKKVSCLKFYVIIIQIIFNFSFVIARTYLKNSTEYCSTPTCLQAAAEILDKMDSTVDPCDNFYRFTCGKFLKEAKIPDDQVMTSVLLSLNDKIQEQLKTMIDQPIKPNDLKPFKLAKNFFKLCTNKTAIEEQGLGPMKKIIKNIGGWPVLEEDRWNESDFNWIKVSHKLSKMGFFVNHFIEINIEADMKNTTKNVIYLDQPYSWSRYRYDLSSFPNKNLKLKNLNYLNENSNNNIYLNYIIEIATIFGANRKFAMNEFESIFNFHRELKNIMIPDENLRNYTLLYNPMTVKELNKKYPSISWKEYLNQNLPSNIKIDENEFVTVLTPKYIENLEKLINKTPKRILANYLIWRVVQSSGLYLTDNIRQKALNYLKAITGETKIKERWKECIEIIQDKMPIAMSALYTRNYFDKNVKNHTQDLVREIYKQFYKILENIDWMDNVTKRNAIEKLENIGYQIAFPDELFDDVKIIKFYENLKLNGHSYLEDILSLRLFEMKNSFGKLKNKVEKYSWENFGNLATVNAQFLPLKNSLHIPAGILQDAFYSNYRPMYMNYAIIGSVIGHEITHGFDDQGRQFDKNGKLADWWAPTTNEKFNKKAECIINQYGNYTIKELGLHLNGITTQGENIADNGGIKSAYFAYKEWSSNHPTEPKLPRLAMYNPAQMFWISASSSWCTKNRPGGLAENIKHDSHSPEEFRVLGSLSNMKEFSNDFNCPIDSKMNPKNRCHVW